MKDIPPPPAVRSTCPYCGVGCGVLLSPDGTGGLAVRGDPEHPANKGRLCSKGTALGETLGLGHRLLQPMVGGAPAPWDEALDLVAAKFRDTVAQHGPDSAAFYVSGQLLTEDYYVANKTDEGLHRLGQYRHEFKALHGLNRGRPQTCFRHGYGARHL